MFDNQYFTYYTHNKIFNKKKINIRIYLKRLPSKLFFM